MENIFKNAYFGKAYKTKEGKKALYIGVDDYSPIHLLFVDDWFNIYDYNNEGFALDDDSTPMSECNLNIVSEWSEEINEEELDKLANEYVCNYGCERYDDGVEAYKAGYRKAKE